MTRLQVNSNPPRPDRPSTTRSLKAALHIKEKPILVRKRGATENLPNPLKKTSKIKKHDSAPSPEFMDDPPYDQVEGTVPRLIKDWHHLKTEDQKLEQKNLLRKSREAELKE
ncbi:hypothetical protein E2P81_ATG07429 [Venturia nashicola]|nr:hypothetical protein E2P81_ATG07429 [Venturia nashicola]